MTISLKRARNHHVFSYTETCDIRKKKDKPFFCYFPITPPHGMYDIPKADPAWKLYENEKWIKDPSLSQDIKNYAAMVSMVDYNVGQVLDLLRELKLEKDTIVFFTGDNGGQDRFRSQKKPRGFFGPNVNPKTGEEVQVPAKRLPVWRTGTELGNGSIQGLQRGEYLFIALFLLSYFQYEKRIKR